MVLKKFLVKYDHLSSSTQTTHNIESNNMGIGISHSEYIDSFNEKRPALASRDRDVDYAIKVEWPDLQITDAEELCSVKVGLGIIPDMSNWIISKIRKDTRYKRLAIIIDLGKGFKDTRLMPGLMTTIAPEIQPLTLNGSTVTSIRVTGEFNLEATRKQRESWWLDFVKLSNYMGLEYELNARYQIDPLDIDQIGVDETGGNPLIAALRRKTL